MSTRVVALNATAVDADAFFGALLGPQHAVALRRSRLLRAARAASPAPPRAFCPGQALRGGGEAPPRRLARRRRPARARPLHDDDLGRGLHLHRLRGLRRRASGSARRSSARASRRASSTRSPRRRRASAAPVTWRRATFRPPRTRAARSSADGALVGEVRHGRLQGGQRASTSSRGWLDGEATTTRRRGVDGEAVQLTILADGAHRRRTVRASTGDWDWKKPKESR